MVPSPSKRIFSWACFDFANSAFHTLIITFIYGTFFVSEIAVDTADGTRLWGNAIALSSILVALLSPALGAVADAYAWKKRMMFLFIIICSGCCFGLFPVTESALLALALVVVANVAVELAIVFNNGFLPELAPADRQGKVSGRAWAFGYLGGLLCLGIALTGFVSPETPWLGFDKVDNENIRATTLLVGVWVLVFSVPMLLWLPERRQTRPPEGILSVARNSQARLGETFRHVRQYRNVFWFLVARTLYNDGLATVFAFGAIYASGAFGFTFEEVLVFGVALNVCSGLGAFGFAYLEDRIGSRLTITISLIALIASSFAAVLVQSQGAFWICAIALGIFIGPNQSASRAYMARQSPPDKSGEFFGFFAFSGKATAFLGPFICGQLTGWADSQRVGMIVVPVLMVSGLAILLWKAKDDRTLLSAGDA